MRCFLRVGALLALGATPVLAQGSSSGASHPDSSGRWEIGVYPTFRKLTYDLAAKHEWGGGATANVGFRITRFAMLSAEFTGAWIPQLNTMTQGQAQRAAADALAPAPDPGQPLPAVRRARRRPRELPLRGAARAGHATI